MSFYENIDNDAVTEFKVNFLKAEVALPTMLPDKSFYIGNFHD